MPNQKETLLLLADDDVDDYELFQDALSELSIPVHLMHCENGVELMHLLQQTPPDQLPDLIFLDLNMPQKSGFDCIREIRSSNTFQHIPVVIFSTSFDPDIVELLYQYGADRYLVKPNNFKALKNVISQVLKLNDAEKLRRTSAEDFLLQP